MPDRGCSGYSSISTRPSLYCLSANTGLPVALITTAMGMTVVQYPGDYTEIDG
ncbi:MAG: hypothetical protein MZU79_01880 [Anaerotruncus sp.]|nr:hypothetical protein [Anaerotruncus sp.]